MSDTDICFCGHVLDEHDIGNLTPCTVRGCDCVDFEHDEPDDDEPAPSSGAPSER